MLQKLGLHWLQLVKDGVWVVKEVGFEQLCSAILFYLVLAACILDHATRVLGYEGCIIIVIIIIIVVVIIIIIVVVIIITADCGP